MSRRSFSFPDFFAGGIFALCLILVATYLWAQSTWPYSRYYVRVKMDNSASVSACELASGWGYGKRFLPSPAVGDDGRIRDCVLEVVGEKSTSEPGGIKLVRRNSNLLNMLSWGYPWAESSKGLPLNKAHLLGICTPEEFQVLLFGGTPGPDCLKPAEK